MLIEFTKPQKTTRNTSIPEEKKIKHTLIMKNANNQRITLKIEQREREKKQINKKKKITFPPQANKNRPSTENQEVSSQKSTSENVKTIKA